MKGIAEIKRSWMEFFDSSNNRTGVLEPYFRLLESLMYFSKIITLGSLIRAPPPASACFLLKKCSNPVPPLLLGPPHY